MENETPLEAVHTQIRALIAEHGKPRSFTGGVSQEVIDEIAKDLSVILPEGYIWFLKNYGHGNIFGSEILGTGLVKPYSVVKRTLYCRERGMPAHFIAIVHCDEYYYCLDTETGKVLNWSPYESGIYLTSESFLDYFLEDLEDAVLNMYD
ncbi:MAG: SMI1/KNR4 family protein [Armatimonadetes bacterium]|nr:SMI1/KNR4 family protein [Armatimonadota bacterium]